MASACATCGSIRWHSSKSWVENGQIVSICSDCTTGLKTSGRADVFFAPNRDGVEINPNIADSNGDPIPLLSREHKATLMRQMNLREAGDSVRGSRNFDSIAHRHGIESLRSADRRRQHG